MRSGIGSRVSRRIVGIGEVSLSIYGPFPKGQHYQSDRLLSHHDRRHHYTMPSHTDRRAIIPPGMRADMLELCTIPRDEVTLHPLYIRNGAFSKAFRGVFGGCVRVEDDRSYTLRSLWRLHVIGFTTSIYNYLPSNIASMQDELHLSFIACTVLIFYNF